MEKHLKVQELLKEAIEQMPTGNSFDEDISFKLRQVAQQLDRRIADLGGSPKPAKKREPKKT